MAKRVLNMTFRASGGPETRYEDRARVEFDHALGHFVLQAGRLRFKPAESFESEEEARRAVEPFLRDWEVHAALRQWPGVLEFQFEQSELEIEDPAAPGEVIPVARITETVRFNDRFHPVVSKQAYPPPPTDFRVTWEVEMAFRRWKAYLAGHEPILGFGYFLYTLFSPQGGRSRRDAAQEFAIDERVLSTLSAMTSNRGGLDETRKVQASTNRSLSDPERAWLEGAARRLVQRLGEHAAGVPLAQIRMDDLPQPEPTLAP